MTLFVLQFSKCESTHSFAVVVQQTLLHVNKRRLTQLTRHGVGLKGEGHLKVSAAGSGCNLPKMHAIYRHSTLSRRPLIASDAIKHMLAKEEGVSDVSHVQAYGSYKTVCVNWI